MLLQLSYLFALQSDQPKYPVLFSFKSTEFIFGSSSVAAFWDFYAIENSEKLNLNWSPPTGSQTIHLRVLVMYLWILLLIYLSNKLK